MTGIHPVTKHARSAAAHTTFEQRSKEVPYHVWFLSPLRSPQQKRTMLLFALL
ncbi:hypothetical protein PISMIDRAFT_674080 [Pisolithus microcarpus 441]|uniref:Unplaced genomic scaffold scaffold_9, whole genome shotgun sequence n=1 Tax=Pisolithus microcarpus 441 TaxID=765257 RepID=A0A0D0A8J1_9AGAM|nr:hypothetical protein PISMIDRAFT_674080 [Pisolithus microcarpus 441]